MALRVWLWRYSGSDGVLVHDRAPTRHKINVLNTHQRTWKKYRLDADQANTNMARRRVGIGNPSDESDLQEINSPTPTVE